jgi:hypothetical protein
MNVTLPNGRVIQNVPEGTTKAQIMAKAIAAGIASESDFVGMAKPASSQTVAGNFADVPSPEQDAIVAQGYANQPKQEAPTMGERAEALGETSLALGTGATTGTLGMLAGTLQQGGRELLSGQFGTPEAASRIEQRAADVMQSATYSPRSPLAGEYLQNISEAAAPLAGLAGLSGQINSVGNASRMAAPVARQAIREAPAELAGQIKSMTAKSPDSENKSIGASQVADAARRREIAAQMPVDPMLTKGQATRDFNQLRFEGETMKSDLGEPLRKRAEQQHQAIRQSFDEFIDQTGATASDAMDAGMSVKNALNARSRRDKAEIKAAYDEANNSKEASAPVNPASKIALEDGEYSLIDYLNSKPSGLRTTGIIDDAKNYAIRLGVAEKADDGSLVPVQTTLKNMEALRKEISQATGYEPTDVRESTILKKIIDAQTESVAGPIYKRARNLRAKYANQYENRAIISDLISNKKGSNDRKVAIEDVFDRIAFRSTNEDARHLRKVLQNEGEVGRQAWRDIQGQALKYIRDEASKNNIRDSSGNEMVSSAGLNKAIKRLDEDGKLELIYGKSGAQKLRDINDLARDLFTAPPGAINHSNTASVITAAMDIALSGTSGVPMPLATGVRMAVKKVKDRRLKKRIQDALRQPEDNQ